LITFAIFERFSCPCDIVAYRIVVSVEPKGMVAHLDLMQLDYGFKIRLGELIISLLIDVNYRKKNVAGGTRFVILQQCTAYKSSCPPAPPKECWGQLRLSASENTFSDIPFSVLIKNFLQVLRAPAHKSRYHAKIKFCFSTGERHPAQHVPQIPTNTIV